MQILVKPIFFLAFFVAIACNDVPSNETNTPTIIESKNNIAKGEVTPTKKNTATSKPILTENNKNAIKEEKMPTKTTTTTSKPVLVKSESKPTPAKSTSEKKNATILKPVLTESKETKTSADQPIKDTAISSGKANPMPSTKTPKIEIPSKIKENMPTPFSHEAWNTLVQKHISPTGKVDYKGFKSDLKAFDAYLKSLAENPVQNDWSKAKKMAYWINAYNAFTIKLIVDNYPVKSIMDLHGGKPWDVKWIKLGDKTYSLNNIEHNILRPQFNDARIHFAVNCAAQSCPPIWNKAWTVQNLDSQLDRAAKSFVNNEKFNEIGKKEVAISKIFEWYAGDFGNIIDYLNQYSDTSISKNATVNYRSYNWALNE